MIESLFKQASTLARLHSGPLAQQLPFLAEALHKERAQWIERRKAELLPTAYFHVVFTLPEPIAAIAFYNKETVYE